MQDSELKSQLHSVPKPPERPKAKETRNFAKLVQQRVYLLDGHEKNPYPKDTKEHWQNLVKAGIDQGLELPAAEARAWEFRKEQFGISCEHGFFGEEVQPWFPGNTAVLLKPIKHPHTLKYFDQFNETTDQTVAKVLWVMAKHHAMITGADETPMPRNEWGAIEVPGLGSMYGTIDQVMTEIVAFILSCHGKIVGKDVLGNYVTEPITFDQVLAVLPPGFVQEKVDENTTVFDEVLTVSTVFNTDLLETEMVNTGEVTEDELKNLMSSPLGREMLLSGSEPSTTVSAKSE